MLELTLCLCAACCMLCGIFVLGLPIVVVGGAFDEVFKEEDEEQKRIALEVQRLEDAAAAETVSPDGKSAACSLAPSSILRSLWRHLSYLSTHLARFFQTS